MEIKPILFSDKNEDILQFISKDKFLAFYNYFLKNKPFTSSSDVIGLKLLDNQNIIGATLLLIHDENGLKIGNIASTYLLAEYRGKGLSSLLINSVKEYCDVVTNLTPVDSIIKLINNNVITDFKNTSKYQIWLNVHNVHKRTNNISVKELQSKDICITESLKYRMRGFALCFNNKKLDICFYGFNRKNTKIIEISYVSDKEIFRDNYLAVIKAISKFYKFNIALIDGVFLDNVIIRKILHSNKKEKISYFRHLFILLFKKQLFLKPRKYYWIKSDEIVWDIIYLSSELCFYS